MQHRWKVIAVAVIVAAGELVWLLRGQSPVPSATVSTAHLQPAANKPAPPLQIPAAISSPSASSANQVDFPAPQAELAAALQISARADRLNALDHLLRDWAARSPGDALAWARMQDSATRQFAIASVLRGMGAQPQSALKLGLLLISQEPQHADDYALAAIQGLSDAGQFSAALKLADAVRSESQPAWCASIFKSWGTIDPNAALQALAAVPPSGHDALFRSVVEGWASSQPAMLAASIPEMPSGFERQNAIDTLALYWSLQDPAAFSAWLSQQQPAPEFDQAITLLLTQSDTANRPAEVAMDWAQRVTDPDKRLTLASELAVRWSATDLNGTIAYVQSASWLQPSERAQIIQQIQSVAANPQLRLNSSTLIVNTSKRPATAGNTR